MKGQQECGQAMIEFALTIGLLMLVIVLTAQSAIYLRYRGDLDTAAREGAFEASINNHSLQDGERAAQQLWSKLEPGAGPIQIQAAVTGNLIALSAEGTAPTLIPPPYPGLKISVRAVHSIERFEPGASSS
jgi:Flp pilus assembly protein TadG